jgi:plasmid stabilization system protein ParE
VAFAGSCVSASLQVRLLPAAEADLEEIVTYVALDDPQAALKLADRIEASLERLSGFPKLGRIPRDDDLRAAGYRYLVSGEYLAFYSVEGRTVMVHRILPGRRDYRELL